MPSDKRRFINPLTQASTVQRESQVFEESSHSLVVPEIALSHQRTSAQVRKKRGYALREDLVKACKRMALEEDRTLYEVMEEALEEYLKRKDALV